ncbi:MAG TPA: aminoacyl-tRNA deacylase [Anaerolineae bacterium]|nr:aminoacyl-tRNA deacylase [Anaerolineae bacterium]HOQ97819.1 aminoacyl-tRNA deacylase [Anaerolineae bacterium]HPL28943.1 aminoacyl-tRNA deacylase [Anaerolineae bacterium]
MAHAPRTNVLRLLEARQVPYQAFSYSDEIHSAEGVAEAIGVPAEQVFKTLVVLRERGRPLLVLLPGGRQLDLRLLARGLGEKKLRMATQREAEALTGLQVGGISALALLHKGFEVCIDASAQRFQEVYVSAGQRGLNVRLPVADLVRLTNARLVEAGGVMRDA